MPSDLATFWNYLDSGFDWSGEPFLDELRHADTLLETDPEAALAEYRALADKGSAAAMMALGNAYASGSHVARDEGEAEHWYRRAAETGSPQFSYVLGRFYASRERYIDAVPAYAAAADRGVVIAKIALALQYAWGRGVERDRKTARRLLEEARKAGSLSARTLLGASLIRTWYHPVRLVRGLWLLSTSAPYLMAILDAGGVVTAATRARLRREMIWDSSLGFFSAAFLLFVIVGGGGASLGRALDVPTWAGALGVSALCAAAIGAAVMVRWIAKPNAARKAPAALSGG